MSCHLLSEPLPPTTLQHAAEQERARRAAASKASVEAGKVSVEKADYDDAIWSNIVHFFRRWSGDTREPQGWSEAQREIMSKSARATYKRMLEVLDGSTRQEDFDKLKGLRDIWYALEFTLLYCKVYPQPRPHCIPGRTAAA
ncbi:hypothetical protein [Sphingobium sp. MI1205]|uniref:hypothetical protein n=1 Tax=Sphingobium sp. MI1205 TaxID=407020 RepID=UPI0007704B7A|nr:hypothetical protein [Sphingobium sp. MI1205]AMK18738.1 hypothetical protein K663_11795 [Sphingobium sp. MI1205]